MTPQRVLLHLSLKTIMKQEQYLNRFKVTVDQIKEHPYLEKNNEGITRVWQKWRFSALQIYLW